MSFENSTQLKIGAQGTLVGIHFQVVGRVVMGAKEDGVTYYWDEFTLRKDDGGEAILVCEPNDYGVEWKLFTYFEPAQKIPLNEAKSKRVGHKVTIDDVGLRIRFVGRSRVYHIEGTAPEGVDLGDAAEYFNAERGDKMYVVSWTGDEVEYYRGANLPPGAVKTAFGLKNEALNGGVNVQSSAWSLDNGNEAADITNRIGMAIVVFVIVAFIATQFVDCDSDPERAPVPQKKPLTGAALKIGANGKIKGTNYSIQAMRVCEISKVGNINDCREYHLESGDGGKVLLQIDNSSKSYIYLPVQGDIPFTPKQAGAIRTGESVYYADLAWRVTDLVQIRDLIMGETAYGFIAQQKEAYLMARWTKDHVDLYLGETIDKRKLESAFK